MKISLCVGTSCKRNLEAPVVENPTTMWKELLSQEEGFRILFPGEPKRSVGQAEGKDGPVPNVRYEVVNRNGYFNFSHADFDAMQHQNAAELRVNYDFLRDGILTTMNAELLRENEIKTDGHLGREFTMKKDNELILYRVFIIDKRQYQLITAVKLSNKQVGEFENASTKFFESFHIEN
jgi:hypothetical protein